MSFYGKLALCYTCLPSVATYSLPSGSVLVILDLCPKEKHMKLDFCTSIFNVSTHVASCLFYSVSSALLDHFVLNYSRRSLHFCLHLSFFKGLRAFQKMIFICIFWVLENH